MAGHGERGAALVVALLLGLLLVALTAALVPLSTIETEVAANHRRAVEGLYAAEAAAALAAAELGGLPDWSVVLNGSVRSAHWGASLAPTMPDGRTVDLAAVAGLLGARGAGGDDAGRGLTWTLVAHGDLASWVGLPSGFGPWLVAVWAADDPADADGDPLVDSNGALVLHAAAYGPRGASRALQATLVRQGLAPPPPAPPVVRSRLISQRVIR